MKSVIQLGVLIVFTILFTRSEGNPLSRIVGGVDVAISEHPWQASLQSSGSHICGASFIDEKWLITAAHCVDGQSASQLSIGHGDSDTSNHPSVPISRYIKHPEYQADGSKGYPNDIALIELNFQVEFDSLTNKVPLANGVDAFTDCWITGWGCYKKDFGILCRTKSALQGTSIQKIDPDTCKERWSDAQVQDMHICVHETSKSACNGDSGGPLTCQQGGRTVLAGATSWGASTCSGDLPSVYARVSVFAGWVRSVTGLELK